MLAKWLRPRLAPVLFLAAVVVAPACGDDGDDGNNGAPNNGTNNGTNNGENNGTNNGANNGANNGGNNGANNGQPADEDDFAIGYVARNRSEVPGIDAGGNFYFIANDGSETVQVNPDGIECHNGCTVSDDLGYFIWAEPDGQGATVRVAPIVTAEWDGFSVNTAEAVTLGQGIIAFSTAGNSIAWETADFEVFVSDLPGSSPTSLGVVGSVEGTQGGFYLKPDGSEIITWTVTLTQMFLDRHNLDAGSMEDDFYTFVSDSFGGTGSFYGPRERMAWSPDGKFLAVISTALVDTDPCTSNEQCVSPETCGANARCTSQRLSLHMLELEHTGNLGGACTADSDCGGPHVCDFADPRDPDSGKCMPGRLDLGAAGPAKCTARQDGEFTDILQEMQWAPDSSGVFLLAQEDCSRFNIPRAAILKVTPDLDDPTIVLENPGSDFMASNCYDENEQEYVVGAESCVLAINELAVAPTGGTLVFAASSPAAELNFELYTTDVTGLREKELLTTDLETVVQGLRPVGDLD